LVIPQKKGLGDPRPFIELNLLSNNRLKTYVVRQRCTGGILAAFHLANITG
jgi:hypothetical protein